MPVAIDGAADAVALPFSERVVAWQRRHGRHGLPWQQSRDPYRVWLSEVMLQQTQVSVVLAYFARFVDRFPDVRALAAAPLDDVLAAWSGLGYYSRARNLHRCAQVVVAEHGGVFPGSAGQLAMLPGIGRSTAAAIAAFCFGERAAILDGNVKRVLARWHGFDGDLALAGPQRALWALAESLLPPAGGVAAYTQGLMDLGAGVCLVREPRCGACPLAADCSARRSGAPHRYPVKTRRARRGQRSDALLWLSWRDRVWLTRRPPSGVWAGLWSLPLADSVGALQASLGGLPGRAECLPAIVHPLTHFDWALAPLRWTLPEETAASLAEELAAPWAPGRWFDRDDAAGRGLPAPVRRLLGL